MSDLKRLLASLPREGRVEWIGLRPRYRGEVVARQRVEAVADHGLEGDHSAARPGGKRQVTLIQAEHLPAVSALLGGTATAPELLRRNILVSGINLLALAHRRFRVGEALLEGTGYCHPCRRMEENLGSGGFNAMRGHGGITARVIAGGTIEVGSPVRAVPGGEPAQAELDLFDEE